MASGFGGSTGGVLGFSPAVSSWNLGGYFGAGGSLGAFIQEAQLDDFLYSWGGPQKIRPIAITASRELPGSTHWDPAPVPVGKKNGGARGGSVVVDEQGAVISVLGIPPIIPFLPDFRNEGQPPIIYSPPPIILPGQVDPGREEQESQEGELAHTWTHLGSQVISGIFGGQPAYDVGPGSGFNLGSGNGAAGAGNGQLGPFDPGPGGSGVAYETGSCAKKTRTLTIDCATGLEIKRKRRRRRALLTQGDMGVLFQIASLPNNANVRVALAGAIRR